jgi:hypothetical protein
MEYFCYISESKVNQLYEQALDSFSETAPNTETDTRISSLTKQLITYRMNINRLEEKKATYGPLAVPTHVLNEIDQSLGELHKIEQELQLLGVITGIDKGVKFGNRPVADRSLAGLADPATLLSRLRKVLSYIHSTKSLGDLNEIITQGGELTAFCYLVNAEFTVDRIDGGIAILKARIGSYSLNLSCSMKYFSDMSFINKDAEGNFIPQPHSMNYHFFNGVIDVQFRSIVFILGKQNNELMGSPIYLMLEPISGLYL